MGAENRRKQRCQLSQVSRLRLKPLLGRSNGEDMRSGRGGLCVRPGRTRRSALTDSSYLTHRTGTSFHPSKALVRLGPLSAIMGSSISPFLNSDCYSPSEGQSLATNETKRSLPESGSQPLLHRVAFQFSNGIGSDPFCGR